jgi:spore coat protein U-like protein
MKRLLIATGVIASLAAAHNANAGSQTANMGMSATVTTVCSLSTTPISFGEVSLSGPTDGTGTISVTCTDDGTYNVGLDTGANAQAGQRQLVSGSNALNYNLYSDSGYSTAWGNTVGTNTVAGTGSGSAQTLTVYGQIPGSQTLHSGTGSATYSDTVTVTVYY